MRKSPFSTPRGNGGHHGLSWNSNTSPGRGYGRPKSYEFYSPNRSQTSQSHSGGEDFIPFDHTPPPVNQRKSSDNWQSPRGKWPGSGGGRGARRQSASPGYTNFRDNRGRDNHQQYHHHHHHHHHHHQQQQQQQPYFKDTGRQFYGQRKNFQRGNTRRKCDISQYMNLRSFLEDPWSELSRKLSNNVSTEESRNDSFSDLSFSNAVLGDVSMDDSAEETSMANSNLKSHEIASDSLIESDNSFIQTSQEFADISACSDSSPDRKLSQDSND